MCERQAGLPWPPYAPEGPASRVLGEWCHNGGRLFWVMDPRSIYQALEEAGLVGEIELEPIGYYSYDKRLRGGRSVSCQVSVFPMWVGRQLKHWPEQGQRETRWLTLGQAAMAVDEGDLVTLLLRLAAPAE
jgi:hypothetical protein